MLACTRRVRHWADLRARRKHLQSPLPADSSCDFIEAASRKVDELLRLPEQPGRQAVLAMQQGNTLMSACESPWHDNSIYCETLSGVNTPGQVAVKLCSCVMTFPYRYITVILHCMACPLLRVIESTLCWTGQERMSSHCAQIKQN